MVCPFSYPDITWRSGSSTQFEVKNDSTGRILLLLPHEVRQLCKSWKHIADKDDFAWNIFNRIFQKDTSIEERYEQYSKWKNESFDSETDDHLKDDIDQPCLVNNLNQWETIAVADREECFNQLMCTPLFETGCCSDDASSIGSIEGTPKMRRVSAFRKKSPLMSRMSFTDWYESEAKWINFEKRSSSVSRNSPLQFSSVKKQDNLQNIRNLCFDMLAVNLAPLVVTDTDAPNSPPKETIQANRLERRLSRPRSLEIISQIRRRKIEKIRRNKVLPHLKDFVKFWDHVIQLLSFYDETGNSTETSCRLLNLARNLGRRHSDIRMATFQAKVTLLMKTAMLEEISLETSQWEGTQNFINEHTVSSMLTGSKGKFRKRQEAGERRGQTIRAWYKLIGFVLAEAKDEYLTQVTSKMERKESAPPCEARFRSNLLAVQTVRISRSTEHVNRRPSVL